MNMRNKIKEWWNNHIRGPRGYTGDTGANGLPNEESVRKEIKAQLARVEYADSELRYIIKKAVAEEAEKYLNVKSIIAAKIEAGAITTPKYNGYFWKQIDLCETVNNIRNQWRLCKEGYKADVWFVTESNADNLVESVDDVKDVLGRWFYRVYDNNEETYKHFYAEGFKETDVLARQEVERLLDAVKSP